MDDSLKEQALRQYAEGVGQRATERLLGVSHNSVMNWVKQEVAGKALAKIDASAITYVEADELWSYGRSAQPPPKRELMRECSHGETSAECAADFPPS